MFDVKRCNTEFFSKVYDYELSIEFFCKEADNEIAVIDCSEINSIEYAVIVINFELLCIYDVRFNSRDAALKDAIRFIVDEYQFDVTIN